MNKRSELSDLKEEIEKLKNNFEFLVSNSPLIDNSSYINTLDRVVGKKIEKLIEIEKKTSSDTTNILRVVLVILVVVFFIFLTIPND